VDVSKVGNVSEDLLARIMMRVDKFGPAPTEPNSPVNGGCWLWTGGRFPAGYGSISVNNQTELVHVLVYRALVGPIPKGFDIDHKCRVRNCCNPAHIEAVSRLTNVLRSRKPYCRHGHLYDEENTVYVKKNPNQRLCRVCERNKLARYREKKRRDRAGAAKDRAWTISPS
jgi:hypothetical protein